jgi:hypothetical protein
VEVELGWESYAVWGFELGRGILRCGCGDGDEMFHCRWLTRRVVSLEYHVDAVDIQYENDIDFIESYTVIQVRYCRVRCICIVG